VVRAYTFATRGATVLRGPTLCQGKVVALDCGQQQGKETSQLGPRMGRKRKRRRGRKEKMRRKKRQYQQRKPRRRKRWWRRRRRPRSIFPQKSKRRQRSRQN